MMQKYLGSIVLLCIAFSMLTSFLITDITSLNSGLGIDGMWYNKLISVNNYKTDDYHLFKSLPSYIIKHVNLFFLIDNSDDNILYSYKILNIASLISCVLVFARISKKYLNDEYNLLTILSICSFTALKVSNYDVVTPDYFGFLLATLFLYFFLSKNNAFLLLILLLSFFTNPIVFLIGIIVLVFSNTLPEKVDNKIFVKLPFVFSILFGIFILVWSIYMIIPMHKAGVELTLWLIPDTLNIMVFPISATLVSVFCAYFSYFLFKHSLRFFCFQNILKLNYLWIIIFFSFSVTKKYLVVYNNASINLDDVGHLLYIWPLYFCMKPLIGVSEHIHSLGILIFFALLFWKKIVLESSKFFGLGGLLIMGLFVIFVIKPEARHTLPFVPILSFLVIRAIPLKFLNFRNILTLFFANILYSKIYYPLHFASFSGNPQEFPAQHYFMFFGFSCNYTMYTFQIIVSILSLLFFKKLFSKYDLSSL